MTDDASADTWDDSADGWDDEAATNAYAAAAFASLNHALDARGVTLAGTTILDFGCGTGLLAERVAPVASAVDAFDTSTAMRDQLVAKIERLGLANVRAVSALPAATATYDIIVCSSVLAFVDSYEDTVAKLAALLCPSGVLVHWDWEFHEKDDDPFGLTRRQVTGGLRAAGLTDVEVSEAFAVEVDGTTMRPLMGVGQKQS